MSQIGNSGASYAWDDKAGGVVTISTFHNGTHLGNTFLYSNKHTVDATTTIGFLMKVPSGVTPHLRYVISGDKTPIDVYLYSGPTITADGSALSFRNANDSSSNTTNVQLFFNPTISADGNRFAYTLIGTGKQTGGKGGSVVPELICKQSTNYYFKITNNNGQTANMEIDFYFYNVT